MDLTFQTRIDDQSVCLSAMQLNQIRRAVYESDERAWQSPNALSGHLQMDGASRPLGVAIWALFGVGIEMRSPCIDWADQAPLFDPCTADERVVWCPLDVVAFANGLDAVTEVTRALSAFDGACVKRCVLFHLPGTRPLSWDAMYDAVEALEAALPKSASLAWTSVLGVDQSRLEGWPKSLAGLFVRFRVAGAAHDG